MNLKYINRKQTLGISHPFDFSDWALAEGNKLIGPRPSWPSVIMHEFDDVDMQKYIDWFDRAIDRLGLEFRHQETETTFYTKTIQTLNVRARSAGIYFYMMDLRPISELGKDLSDSELLDKMVTECGCIPINPYWLAYSPEDGRQTLKVIFEISVVPYDPDHAAPTGENGLAEQFLACFDDSVRFYGNSCFAPWDGKTTNKQFVQSKRLHSLRDVDFGLILRDSNTIGFLMLTAEYP